MSKDPPDLFEPKGRVVHMAPFRESKVPKAQIAERIELSLVDHFREQNENLSRQNMVLEESIQELHAKVDRLTSGLELLVGEMHGIRTGKREEAFARVAPRGSNVDLPTVKPDAALIYGVTASDVGEELRFRPSEIGVLLSARGLGWADNADYQEVSRRKRHTQQHFWVNDMAARLARILNENDPGRRGITDKTVLAIFRKWASRGSAATVKSD